MKADVVIRNDESQASPQEWLTMVHAAKLIMENRHNTYTTAKDDLIEMIADGLIGLRLKKARKATHRTVKTANGKDATLNWKVAKGKHAYAAADTASLKDVPKYFFAKSDGWKIVKSSIDWSEGTLTARRPSHHYNPEAPNARTPYLRRAGTSILINRQDLLVFCPAIAMASSRRKASRKNSKRGSSDPASDIISTASHNQKWSPTRAYLELKQSFIDGSIKGWDSARDTQAKLEDMVRLALMQEGDGSEPSPSTCRRRVKEELLPLLAKRGS